MAGKISYDGGQSFYGELNDWLNHVKKQQASAGSDVNPVLRDVELRAAEQYYNKHLENSIDFNPEIWDRLYTEGARPFDITEWASEIRKQKGIDLPMDEVLKRLEWLNVAVDPDAFSKNPEAIKELILFRQDQRYNASGDSKPLKSLAPSHAYSYWAAKSLEQVEGTEEFKDVFREMVDAGTISYDKKADPRGIFNSVHDVREGSMVDGASFGYGESEAGQISIIDSERGQFTSDVNLAHNIAADPTGVTTIADFDGDAKELQKLTRMVGSGLFTLDGDIEYGKLGNITGGNATLVPTEKLASLQTTDDIEDAFNGAFEEKYKKTTKGDMSAGNLPHITIAQGNDKVMGVGGMADPGKGGGMSEVLAQGKNIKGSKLSIYDYIQALQGGSGETLTRDQLMELMYSHGIPESGYDVAQEFIGSNYVDLPQNQQVLIQSLANDGELIIHPNGEIDSMKYQDTGVNTYSPEWVTDSQGVVRDANRGPVYGTAENPGPADQYLKQQKIDQANAFGVNLQRTLYDKHGIDIGIDVAEGVANDMRKGVGNTTMIQKLRNLGVPAAAITMILTSGKVLAQAPVLGSGFDAYDLAERLGMESEQAMYTGAGVGAGLFAAHLNPATLPGALVGDAGLAVYGLGALGYDLGNGMGAMYNNGELFDWTKGQAQDIAGRFYQMSELYGMPMDIARDVFSGNFGSFPHLMESWDNIQNAGVNNSDQYWMRGQQDLGNESIMTPTRTPWAQEYIDATQNADLTAAIAADQRYLNPQDSHVSLLQQLGVQ